MPLVRSTGELGCLPSPVPLLDIHDLDAYVGAAITRLRLVLDPWEREELEAEGYALLCEMASTWEDRGAMFSWQVRERFEKRLCSALHDLRGDIRPRADDGSRRWLPRPETSLDQLLDTAERSDLDRDDYAPLPRMTPMTAFARVRDPSLAVAA